MTQTASMRTVFVLYAVLGLAVWLTYRRLTPGLGRAEQRLATPLGASKRIVYRLSLLFSLDAFGGGFVVQSILVLWLTQRHGLSATTAGVLFFWAGLASGASALLAAPLARRIGLVRTMVFTHLPANAFLVSAALMPTTSLAVACLLARAALSQMDVPARTSYVMAVVSTERAARGGGDHQRAAQPGGGGHPLRCGLVLSQPGHLRPDPAATELRSEDLSPRAAGQCRCARRGAERGRRSAIGRSSDRRACGRSVSPSSVVRAPAGRTTSRAGAGP